MPIGCKWMISGNSHPSNFLVWNSHIFPRKTTIHIWILMTEFFVVQAWFIETWTDAIFCATIIKYQGKSTSAIVWCPTPRKRLSMFNRLVRLLSGQKNAWICCETSCKMRPRWASYFFCSTADAYFPKSPGLCSIFTILSHTSCCWRKCLRMWPLEWI